MPNQQLQPAAVIQPGPIAGLVERVTFHNDETGFCVLRIKARGHRELVTVVGTLPEVRAGEWLEAWKSACKRDPRREDKIGIENGPTAVIPDGWV